MIGKKSNTIYGLITLPNRNPNLMATLYYARHDHIAETRTQIPTPYFCRGQESESVFVSKSRNTFAIKYQRKKRKEWNSGCRLTRPRKLITPLSDVTLLLLYCPPLSDNKAPGSGWFFSSNTCQITLKVRLHYRAIKNNYWYKGMFIQ